MERGGKDGLFWKTVWIRDTMIRKENCNPFISADLHWKVMNDGQMAGYLTGTVTQ